MNFHESNTCVFLTSVQSAILKAMMSEMKIHTRVIYFTVTLNIECKE